MCVDGFFDCCNTLREYFIKIGEFLSSMSTTILSAIFSVTLF
jgi:hypothetical protein